MPKFIKLALIAADEAIKNANCSLHILREGGICIGSGMAPLDIVGSAHLTLLESGQRRVNPHLIPRILPNMAAGHVSIEWGITGPLSSPSTACATGTHAIGDAFRLIRHGYASIMLAGATEAAVNPLAVAGFGQARALSTSFPQAPEQSSRPFDRKRDGFVIGEGAAVLVLESLQSAQNRNAPILAEICGYGCSADAHHITASHPKGHGAIRSMEAALIDAQSSFHQVDYVNAHATSTPLGDRIEALALAHLAKERIAPLIVGSNKGAIGHLLGAAGAVEIAFSVMALQEGIIPPTLNFTSFDDDLNDQLEDKLVVPSTLLPHPLQVILKNSFGFGGTNASIVLKKFSK